MKLLSFVGVARLRERLSTPQAIGWILALVATLFFSMATPTVRWVILAGANPVSVVLALMFLSKSLQHSHHYLN